ncbi:unnamed protein product [Moneuplotes crassus]|uniref:Uncharacterized protein n=1 Tax=Euplotes crassus TaxID=5936 RepID=A0AAD1XJR7_EUPCR|nr:unnamed protein product [Moneuplotes crassus]
MTSSLSKFFKICLSSWCTSKSLICSSILFLGSATSLLNSFVAFAASSSFFCFCSSDSLAFFWMFLCSSLCFLPFPII